MAIAIVVAGTFFCQNIREYPLKYTRGLEKWGEKKLNGGGDHKISDKIIIYGDDGIEGKRDGRIACKAADG